MQGKPAGGVGGGVAGDGRVAVALQGVQHRPPGVGLPVGVGVVEVSAEREQIGVACAALQRDDPGADRRTHRLQREDLGDPVGLVDPAQPGHRGDQHVEVTLIEAHHPGVDVAAQRFDAQVRVVHA